MIKDTFTTLKKNPEIILMYLSIFLITTLLSTITVFFGMPRFEELRTAIRYESFHPNALYFILVGLSAIGGILMAIFVTPPIGNYVYEACSGNKEKGWYMRGLKRCWWKIVALGAVVAGIMIACMLVMAVLAMLLRAVSIILAPVWIVFMIAVSTYLFISMTAVFAEDDFAAALKNTFKVGNRYFFKLLGTMFVAYLPLFIVSSIYAFSGLTSVSSIGVYSAGYWVLTILYGLYGVCAISFINTYSMQNYLYERSILAAVEE